MSRREVPQRSVRRTAPAVRKQPRRSASMARSTRSGSSSKQAGTPRSASPQRKLRAISAKPATGRFKIGNQRRRIQIIVAFVLVMLIVVTTKVIGLQTAGGDAMRAKQQINGPEQEQLSLTEARFSIVMVKNSLCRFLQQPSVSIRNLSTTRKQRSTCLRQC